MAKAVLISIRPEWVEKILAGEKTLEVRKNRPKLETPFKVYIYCTNPKNIMLWNARSYIYADDHSHNAFDRCWNGSVVGEFACGRITNLSGENLLDVTEDEVSGSCLSAYQALSYLAGGGGYGWHISNLKIYDKPKQLSEFTRLQETKFGYEPNKIKRPPQSWFYVRELENG